MLFATAQVAREDQGLVLRDWVALGAFAASLAAVAIAVRNYTDAKARDRRDLFLTVHERLLEPEMVAARRVLYKLSSEAGVRGLREEDTTRVYRLLAMYDLVGLYVESNWISKKTVLEEWSFSLCQSHEPGRRFIKVRQAMVGGPGWPHYRRLAEAAVAHEKTHPST
jgi:hypothetical protein